MIKTPKILITNLDPITASIELVVRDKNTGSIRIFLGGYRPHSFGGLKDDFEEKKTSSMSGRRDPHDMENSKIDNDVTGRFVTERKNIHPTVKPVELMKYLCRLVTPKGGTVLDPFMGSGSTGMAAKDEGFEFIGIEKEKEYFEIAEQRINTTSPLLEFIK